MHMAPCIVLQSDENFDSSSHSHGEMISDVAYSLKTAVHMVCERGYSASLKILIE